MHYFIGNTFGATITGIEKALINRLQLFRSHQVEAKLVFLSWNPNTMLHAENYGIQHDIFTMYDYFQQSIYIQSVVTHDWINYWQHEMGFNVRYLDNSTDVRIYCEDQFIMYAHFHDASYKRLGYINYFNDKRQKLKREYYDSRGFLSCTKTLYDNKVLSAVFYTPDGRNIIEKYFTIQADKSTLNHIIIKNFHGKDYHLNSEEELIALFYRSIYQPGDLFFSDKAAATAKPFTMIESDIPVVAVLHSTHVKNNFNIEHSDIKNIYSPMFNHLDRFKALVVSTEQQRIDVSKRISNRIPVYRIPVGYVNEDQLIEKRQAPPHHRLISIARLEPEKQLSQQLCLIAKLKNDFPDIELHLFGHGSEKEKLQQLIEELKLEQHVKLRGFSHNIHEELQKANISLITSHTEGFSLALLESLSQGVPCISYDINYGPAELIKNSENGFLIPFNDEEALYEKTKLLLENITLQQQLIDNCLSYARHYNSEVIFNQWQQLLFRLKN